MEKDTIITLEDQSNYALLDETVIEDKKYFFAVKLDEKKNPTTEFEIFKIEEENGEIYMDTLEDEILKQTILIDFTSNYLTEIEESQ